MELTLSQKSFIAEKITELCPELNDKSYEIASYFTSQQRGLFLNHYYQKRMGEAKEMIDTIKNLQAHI